MTKADRGTLRFCITFLALLLVLFSCVHLFAESKKAKKGAAPKSQSTFRVPVNIVVVNATVTDRVGNPVTDLTPSDFRLFDDGKPQTIQTFALESYGPVELEAAKIQAPSPKQGAEKRNAVRPRLISILIDDLTMETTLEFARIVEAVKEFIKKDAETTDQVAILSGSRNVQFPFTSDRQRLLEEADMVLQRLNLNWNFRYGLSDFDAWSIANHVPGHSRIDDPWIGIAALRQNDEAEFRTHNLMNTIRQHLRALRHFEGNKSVVLFSDGFLAQRDTAAAYQLQGLVELALHSGIVLNSVSTRGIPTYFEHMFPDSDGRDDTDAIKSLEDDKAVQESTLAQLASDTGGQFFNNNNLYKGLRDIIHRKSYYYILTYAMPPQKADGSYHNIRLEVTRPGLELSYRKGYYTPKEELAFENREKEDIMDALNGPGNMKEIPITLAYNYFQQDDSTYEVSFLTNVNIRGLRFIEEDARRKNSISLVLVAFDEADHYISGLEKSIDFQLLESSYAILRKRGLISRVQLKLPMGRYKIKAVVRESAQGKIGSITEAVEIP